MTRLDLSEDSNKSVWNVCKEHWEMYVLEQNNVVLNGTQCWEKTVYIDKVRAYISQFIYTYVMMNMKLLEVITWPSIHHGCSSRKTFWEEKFTVGEFSALKMKIWCCRNVGRHREIKDSDKQINLDI